MCVKQTFYFSFSHIFWQLEMRNQGQGVSLGSSWRQHRLMFINKRNFVILTSSDFSDGSDFFSADAHF